MTEDGISIRDIVEVEEMRAVEELQMEVWGMPERDIVSVFMLRATNAAGGVLVGAFDGATLAGFAYGFVGLEDGRAILHSDMLAVLPAYRGRDVGYRLKLAQRERALARGLRVMTWTFDPLQARNARLNFGKLGVVSARYFVNFYGERSSSFLHSTGTDRLWVTWLLDSPRVRQRAATTARVAFDEWPARARELPALVRVGDNDAPVFEEDADAASQMSERVLVEIPGDITALEERQPALALEWRLATRRAFTSALAAGYLVEEFFRIERAGRRVGAYLLTAGRTPEDFAK
ncbi:MAG TPA: GNAT family N-acetyltransferase [Pyrinomonadaceae bacterium]